MALDWIGIENALVTWLSAATGVAVVWEHANAAAPALPYATLRLSGPRPAGGALVEQTTELANPPGEEVVETASLPLELTVTAKAFSDATTGTGTARDLLTRALVQLAFSSRRAAFDAAGLTLVTAGEIADETSLVGTTWQSRAAMDVRFRCMETAVEKAGYIEQVGLVDQTT